MAARSSFFQWLAACVLLVASAAAMAQQAPEPPGTSAEELLRLGTDALRQIDEDQSEVLWASSSALLKTKVAQAEFVNGMRKSRAAVGTVAQRNWAGVSRIRYQTDSTDVPAGLYANIDFATQTSNGKAFYEKLSFRFEPDGWRFTGYVPRDAQ